MGIIIRQSIKATVFNYLGAFIGFLTTFFILTKFLEPEVIGLTKVIYEVAALVAGFAQLGTSASAMRFFPYFKDVEKNHNGFFFYLMLMPAIGSVVFVVLFWLLKSYVIDFFIAKSALLLDYYNWIIPLIVFLTFWGVLETYANILLRIVVPKFIREVGIRVMLLAVYVLYILHWIDLTGLVTGFIMVYAIAMVATFFYVSRITSLSLKHNFAFIDKVLFKKIVKYTLFLIVGALSGNLIAQLDLFMVSSEMGLDYAGVFTVASYMAFVIEIPGRSITSISSPIAAVALKEGDIALANQLYKKVSLHQLMAGSILFLLVWINIDNIFSILPNGEIYKAGKWVVFFIAMARLVGMTLGFGSTLISFSRYYYWGLYFTFFLTVLTVVSNYLFIPVWGITGAAMATFLTCVVSYFFQQWIVLKKIGGNPYSWSTFKQVLLILLLLGFDRLLPVWQGSPWGDLIYRSILVGGLCLLLEYKLRISDEVCALIRKYLPINFRF